MNRRNLMKSGAALGAGLMLPQRSFAQAPQVTIDPDFDEFLSEYEAIAGRRLLTVASMSFVSEDKSTIDHKAVSETDAVPALSAEELKEILLRQYWNLQAPPTVSWPSADRAADYGHLSLYTAPSAKFALTSDVLRMLADRNAFSLKTSRPVIIFGLRGCEIADGAPSHPWAKSHDLVAASPDHVNSRCVLGIWRVQNSMLSVYQASTVPAVKLMYTALGKRGLGTSLLPTGLYAYAAGSHNITKPASLQRGALRISDSYIVLRATNELQYNPYLETTFWSGGDSHNIHAGGPAVRFSCAGCQVVPGTYTGTDRRTPTGEWAGFQKAAGLVDSTGEFIAADEGPTFLYMLLTGKEAALAAQGSPAFANGYYRLRKGSSGPKVEALQKKLLSEFSGKVAGLKASGSFDALTSLAVLLSAKKTTGEYASPISLST